LTTIIFIDLARFCLISLGIHSKST